MSQTTKRTATGGMARAAVGVLSILLLAACAAQGPRQLMPTPLVYQQGKGKPVYVGEPYRLGSVVDLLYITDRAIGRDAAATGAPYGEQRAKQIAFGSAQVSIGAGLDPNYLEAQSRQSARSKPLPLELGRVRELGRFPSEPYGLMETADGKLTRDPAVMASHEEAKAQLRGEVQSRLKRLPRKEVVLYVHGFNETFESAALTMAELCHYLGRESVCALFTWPASASGDVLTSYTSTTESAQYAVGHLKKTIRLLAHTPGVERIQLLAHSRGSALVLDAVKALLLESIAAGQDPVEALGIDNIVLFSPDIDLDVGAQTITAYVSDPDVISAWPSADIPLTMRGRLTIYASPQDRALLVSRLLFRSRSRVGDLDTDDISLSTQHFLERLGRIDFIVYEGKRTDALGHSYYTTSPQVSSDVIQMLRYGRQLGEPGRELIRAGPVVWKFPPAESGR
jgi:esterase/lipase superfamily enzyme